MTDNILQPLGTESDSSFISRRIEWLTPKQTLITIILYAICNIIVIIGLIFGPSYFTTQKMKFDSKLGEYSSRRFSFDFDGLSYFNDFLTLDLYFNRTKYINLPYINFTYFVHANLMLGSKNNEKFQIKSKSLITKFPLNSEISDKIRIFSKGIIKFDSLNALVTLSHPDGYALSGFFEWNFADPSHSMVQIFIRGLFFLISLIILINLLISDFSVKKCHVSTKMMFYLDIILIFASDPLYILSFFTSSPVFKLIDSILCLFLLFTTTFVALSVLLMSKLTYSDISQFWLSLRYIPFFIAFCLFAISSIYSAIMVDKDPLQKSSKFINIIGYSKLIFVAIYILSLIIASFIFKTDTSNEKPAYSFMSLIMIFSILISEFYNTLDPYLGTDSAIQTFTFVSVSIYVFFFNYINWPTDNLSVNNNDDQEENNQNIF